MNELAQSQAAKLGQLIQAARKRTRSSIADCSNALGIDPKIFEEMEKGDRVPSLPEVEVMAMFLDVPMDYFWGGDKLPTETQKDYVKYMTLRHVIIGTTLRQYRDNRRMKLEELANEVGISQEELGGYETGQPVSFLDLAIIVRALDRTIMDMTDDDYGPLAQHENEIAQKQKFDDMPEDMKAFVVEPINKRYVEAAIQLSQLDVGRLRSIGESLLEITY